MPKHLSRPSDAIEQLGQLVMTGTANDIIRQVTNIPGLTLELLQDMIRNWNRAIYDCFPVLEAIRLNIYDDASPEELERLETRLASVMILPGDVWY
jgi:hypothetical protein